MALHGIMSSERLTGRVKWFNNKSGYGFISTCDDESKDIFAHYSAIRGYSEEKSEHKYKYLVQGEYVEFSLAETDDEKHQHKAGDICGIRDGPLMCDTRNEQQATRKSIKK